MTALSDLSQPAEASDTERNFSFKVTSPLRVLLLQAEGSLEMQEWIDTLQHAITHAIHGALPDGDTPTKANGSSVSSSVCSESNLESESMPV